jgi:hypothetical protein
MDAAPKRDFRKKRTRVRPSSVDDERGIYMERLSRLWFFQGQRLLLAGQCYSSFQSSVALSLR